MREKTIAIIDLGSNSARMVVEKLKEDGTYQEVFRVKEDTRLSQGMGDSLMLQEEPIKRTLRVLTDYRERLTKFSVEAIYGITTAAVRTAKNQQDFLDRVYEAIGVRLRVLTGEEEAHYDFLGVLSSLPDEQSAVILDTGGASVELIPYHQKVAEAEVSLPFGAVNLSEKYHLADVISEEDIKDACRQIHADYEKLPFIGDNQGQPVILLGGANRSLAKMAEKKGWAKQHQSSLHGLFLSATRVEQVFSEISQMNRKEREHLAGLEKNRADIIISGLLPVLNLIRVLHSPKVVFSESGVREGLIFELIQKEFSHS
ncbi:Ppx/GppA phosphatase family protein [Fructobacillus durionis]|uniref:Exopolyphosphatase / guanosine-5'-triphosphate,3'-diphosphate pyrophosphatase n=1 Tax=Fructobacillus durionis TaxID=283737 RepID=A0A1I1GQQ7_9LACO|nr:exopolyphosphatase [Fructobacillus durionis]SFC11583.1 exopolyphosphatase / guanosine-5'-triphosphate,3'-diphosphate pyrophosphatase [Fructobacillus durionis]